MSKTHSFKPKEVTNLSWHYGTKLESTLDKFYSKFHGAISSHELNYCSWLVMSVTVQASSCIWLIKWHNLMVEDLIDCRALKKILVSYLWPNTIFIISDDWEIPFEKITDLQFISSGGQGAVFSGYLNNTLVAIKKVSELKDTDIANLRKLNHPNIVQFKGVILPGMTDSVIVNENYSRCALRSHVFASWWSFALTGHYFICSKIRRTSWLLIEWSVGLNKYPVECITCICTRSFIVTWKVPSKCIYDNVFLRNFVLGYSVISLRNISLIAFTVT